MTSFIRKFHLREIYFSFISDCLKHDQSLCHECRDVGICGGQAADNCEIIRSTINHQLIPDRPEKNSWLDKNYPYLKTVGVIDARPIEEYIRQRREGIIPADTPFKITFNMAPQ